MDDASSTNEAMEALKDITIPQGSSQPMKRRKLDLHTSRRDPSEDWEDEKKNDDSDLEEEDEVVVKKKKNDPKSANIIGCTFYKQFGNKDFEGRVVSYDPDTEFYGVEYEDGDEEELSEDEISALLKKKPKAKEKRKKRVSAEQTSPDEEKPARTQKSRYGRVRKIVSYADDSNDDDDDSDVSLMELEETKKSKRKSNATSRKRAASSKSSRKRAASYGGKRGREEEEQSSFSESSQSSSSDDGYLSDVVSSEEEEPIKKRKGKKAAAAAPKKKATTTTTSKKAAAAGKTKMCDAFQPMNTPAYNKLSLKEIHDQKEFLDPCGMEATDDIIGSLVGEQVDKIGALLQRALCHGDNLGSANFPLQLGTACSGTDAPALAMTLVQEQMELRDLTNLFHFTHEFSCEVDPFKQAYLARNFDSVLYPDITKLTDEEPRDVYGQVQRIPHHSMFVAGTSCKNFSMLRSNRRIDIEEKGCSGETFLGAVEFLFKEKPPFVIFENVIGAPWAKMQEYITGRIKLSDCDSSKAIKNIENRNQELTFALENDRIIVDDVPAVYGVRCGAVVAGYFKPGSKKLHKIKWPKEGKGNKKGKGNKRTLSDLIKENNISRKDDTLVLETECTYCTHLAKVDTKEYGLPQTRLRTYMFVWRPDNDDVSDDLGTYWEALVKFLKSPVRHSLQAFILQVDHDIIRVFREALNGPAGRRTSRAVFLEPDFWTSANMNLPHNKVARAKLGMEDTTRFITRWGGFGKKQVPPHYWLEYSKCNNQRAMDLLDILHASAARDAESHDSSFASFFWNISQNASKEKHRSACTGIAGCITPGGDFFLPHEGRPLLGCEKLLIQGIPYFRLLLGNETEVQLGDLAGNAMSLTVVGATMLAAIACKQLRRETLASPDGDMERILSTSAALDSNKKSSAWKGKVEDDGAQGIDQSLEFESASSLFHNLSSLAPDAVKSSIWCTCETSGSTSQTTEFLECKACRVSCCRNCICTVAGYNLESHDTVDVHISAEDHSLGNFQSKLRNVLPPSLFFNKEAMNKISSIKNDNYRVSGLQNYKFNLHRIKRDRKRWLIIYYARENCGVGEAIAEFRITVGELQRESIVSGEQGDLTMGMMGEWTSFLPAKTEPLVYGPLDPCLVVTLKHGNDDATWRVRAEDSSCSLVLEGRGRTDSPRVEVGLTDVAASSLKEATLQKNNSKVFKAAKARGEERRWKYPKGWKAWPETITIHSVGKQSSDSSYIEETDLAGTYERARCRQTMNQSALWVKQGAPLTPPRYILIKPNINRTGPDRAIISSSISHNDSSSILAVLPWEWQPCDALDPESHKVENVSVRNWEGITDIECRIPTSAINVVSPADSSDVLVSVSGLNNTDVNMLCRGNETSGDLQRLNVTKGQKAQQTVRVFNSICVAPILKHAAGEGFLKLDLSPSASWHDISPSDPAVPFGFCRKTIPQRPTEEWFYDDDRRAWERRSEPGASRKYYLALHEAPEPFELWMDKAKRSLQVKYFPEVIAHHAANQLIEGRGEDILQDNVSLRFRLSDVAQQSDPVITPFKVSNCDSEEPTVVTLRGEHVLYERQQKVVTKMLAIEKSNTGFEELEMSEQEMPGSTGLSLIAKATRKRKICGGVIADAIGAGKTVISIAIILQGLEKARHSRECPAKSGASLVVVPPALIDQWQSEIKKFTTTLSVLQIYDYEHLAKVTVKEMIEADVVICPIDILEYKGYMDRVVKAAGLDSTVGEVPQLPTYTGQIEQNTAKGVWIPATSADPYAGANNSNNQKRRNQSAYYTYVYDMAIQKMRQKEFKPTDKGVPLEYFEYERIFVDEIHESLCTTRDEMKLDKAKDMAQSKNGSLSSGFFKEKNRRAGRELLGITQKDIRRRPLLFRRAIFGLTGTPLLDSSSRVIELANLMGNTYIIGLWSHWRKLERESRRDIFLHNILEPKQSREVRKNIFSKCQDYLQVACCRNKTGEEMEGIELVNHRRIVRMTSDEEKLYLASQNGINESKQSLSIKPEDFDVNAGHDISVFLRQNAKLESRGKELVKICKEILSRKGDEQTKIVVFTDGRIGAGEAARDFLCADGAGLGCTWLDNSDTVEEKNKKIAWYQTGDATDEDRARPRVLVLHFEHAAGLNLQAECHDLILFAPLYVGEGGTSSSDPVSDASTELQAIGRVFRAGQTSPTVNVYRIEVQGPDGEECLDAQLIRRNTDEEIVSMAVNAGE